MERTQSYTARRQELARIVRVLSVLGLSLLLGCVGPDPWADTDGDGIADDFDCNPTSAADAGDYRDCDCPNHPSTPVECLEDTEAEGDDPGECDDGADNDQDGLFDCDDPDCEGSPDCQGDDDDVVDDDDDATADEPALDPLEGTQENIIGDVDWIPAYLLDAGSIQAFQAEFVAYLSFHFNDGTPNRCTATLVSPTLLITNQHCVAAGIDRTSYVATFDYWQVGDYDSREAIRAGGWVCDSVVVENPTEDVALIRCDPADNGGLTPAEMLGGWVDLPLTWSADLTDELFLIHTNCDSRDGPMSPPVDPCSFTSTDDDDEATKKLSPAEVVEGPPINDYMTLSGSYYYGDHAFGHDGDTDGGSSGALVFNSAGAAVGLHHVGSASYNIARLFEWVVANTPDFASTVLEDIETWAPCSDDDGDLYGSPASPACLFAGEDCDDGNAAIHPGASEFCDEVDSDCIVGNEPYLIFYRDEDSDGWGTSDSSEQCFPSTPYSASVDGDCDDDAATVNPGATEVSCDEIDNDCLDGDSCICTDIDGDDYGDGPGCLGLDCNDSEPLAWSGATEVACDGVDNDCVGGDAPCPEITVISPTTGSVLTQGAASTVERRRKRAALGRRGRRRRRHRRRFSICQQHAADATQARTSHASAHAASRCG